MNAQKNTIYFTVVLIMAVIIAIHTKLIFAVGFLIIESILPILDMKKPKALDTSPINDCRGL